MGGGCCPTNYSCGTELCSATGTASAQASVGSVIAKEGSNGAGCLKIGNFKILIVGALCIGAIMA